MKCQQRGAPYSPVAAAGSRENADVGTTGMNIMKAQVVAAARDREIPFQQFDEESKTAFINVWEVRLREAVECHKREDLRALAQGVLDFVKTRVATDLRLYAYMEGTEGVSFVFDTGTEEYFQIIGNGANHAPHGTARRLAARDC